MVGSVRSHKINSEYCFGCIKIYVHYLLSGISIPVTECISLAKRMFFCVIALSYKENAMEGLIPCKFNLISAGFFFLQIFTLFLY